MSENSIAIEAQIPGPEAPPAPSPAASAAQAPENPQAAPPQGPEETAAPVPASTPPPSPAPAAELESKRQEAHDLLASSGIDYAALEDEYAEHGRVSDESYAALEKAGFPKKLVDTYIAGLEAESLKAQVHIDKEVEGVKAAVGGEAAYARLTEWAAQNLPPEEIDGYNGVMETNNPAAMKMAVQMLQARYEAVMGREPRYVNGRGGSPASGDVYRSWQEVSRDMADPRYAKDPAFIRKVQEKMDRSPL